MKEYFNTGTVICFGASFVIIYVMVLLYQKRIKEFDFSDSGSVFFAASSIIGGFKLSYLTVTGLNMSIIETDKFYTFYGGLCVVFLSFRTLYSKIKRPIKPE